MGASLLKASFGVTKLDEGCCSSIDVGQLGVGS